MIKHFRVFQIDLEKEIDQIQRGKVFSYKDTEDNNKLHSFFKSHVVLSGYDDKSKNFRFISPHEGMLNLALKTFESEKEFEESTSRIAEKLQDNIDRRKFRHPFFLIIFSIVDEGDLDDMLAILIMDTNDGVQMKDTDNFRLIEDLLPGVRSRLQKCAFIYKNGCENYKSGNEINDRLAHSLILDRKGTSIAQYFMRNFMDSKIVADDRTNTTLAEKAIKQSVSNYLKIDSSPGDVEKRLKNVLSRGERVDYEALVNSIGSYLDIEKLNDVNFDLESISEKAFELAKFDNPTAQKEFKSQLPVVPKVVFKDREDPKKLKISVAQEYMESGQVEVYDNYSENTYDISFDMDLVEKVETT